MNMKRLLCALLAFALLLTGCAGSASSSSSASVANAAEASAVSGEDAANGQGMVTLRWWAFPTFAQDNAQDVGGTYEQKLINAFEATHPGIRIELTMLDFTTGPEKLSLALASGKACDVLLDAPGRIISYGKSGWLAPVSDLLDDAFCADVNNDALIGACMDGDTAYMVPLSSAPFYMAFNRQMLEQAGVEQLVHDGWTTDAFTTVLEALHGQGFVPGSVFCADQGGDQGTRAFFANLYDAPLIDPGLTAYASGSAQGIETARYIKHCVDRGLLKNGTYANGTRAILDFVNGEASFSLLWGPCQQNSYQSVLDDNGIEVVEVPYPSQDGCAELEYLVNGLCVMDSGDAARIAAAKQFVTFVCGDAVWGPRSVQHTGCIPVRTSFGRLYSSERMARVMEWTAYYAPYYNTVKGFSAMRAAWVLLLKNLLNGYLEPQQALRLFDAEANRSLAG